MFRTGEFPHRLVWTAFVMHENITELVCEELLVIKLTELCVTLSLTSFHTSVMNKVNDNYTVVHYRVTT